MEEKKKKKQEEKKKKEGAQKKVWLELLLPCLYTCVSHLHYPGHSITESHFTTFKDQCAKAVISRK